MRVITFRKTDKRKIPLMHWAVECKNEHTKSIWKTCKADKYIEQIYLSKEKISIQNRRSCNHYLSGRLFIGFCLWRRRKQKDWADFNFFLSANAKKWIKWRHRLASVQCANAKEKGHSCGLIFSGHLFVPVWRSSRRFPFGWILHVTFETPILLHIHTQSPFFSWQTVNPEWARKKIRFIAKADNFCCCSCFVFSIPKIKKKRAKNSTHSYVVYIIPSPPPP